ncbi:MAG: hypothetical protein ACPGYM_04355 [Flavobacteriales bacterium]
MATLGAKINHPSYGEGVIFNQDGDFWRVYFQEHGEKEFNKSFDSWELVEEGMEEGAVDLSDLTSAVEQVFEEHIYRIEQHLEPAPIELGDRWDGGTLIMQPGDDGLQAKEVPVETFFHKIVMVRDRLRVMEQQINAQDKLSDEDKVNLQQYITRIYGSLTTFNVLFKYKEDHFKGASKSGEGS